MPGHLASISSRSSPAMRRFVASFGDGFQTGIVLMSSVIEQVPATKLAYSRSAKSAMQSRQVSMVLGACQSVSHFVIIPVISHSLILLRYSPLVLTSNRIVVSDSLGRSTVTS